MEGIAIHLKNLRLPEAVPEDRRTEYGEFLREFCHRLNEGRKAKALAEITMSRMGRLLKTMGCRDVQDMYVLIEKCRGAKSFGGLFWHLYNENKYKAKV